VSLVSDSNAALPRYIAARITAPRTGERVLIVPLNVDAAKGTLNARGIRLIDSNDGGDSADDTIGGNCLGLAFFHGAMPPNGLQLQAQKVYLLYECFSGFTRVATNASLLKKARVHAAGEAVLLDLETGGQLLVYWHGGAYHSKIVRLGD
jgi:hypothetical protein